MKKETLAEKFALVHDDIIGLWKFRQAGKKPVWCTTYSFNGKYYDTQGKATPEAALDQLLKDVTKLKKSMAKKIVAKGGLHGDAAVDIVMTIPSNKLIKKSNARQQKTGKRSVRTNRKKG